MFTHISSWTDSPGPKSKDSPHLSVLCVFHYFFAFCADLSLAKIFFLNEWLESCFYYTRSHGVGMH